MEGRPVSFLRKQQSRFISTQVGTQAIGSFTFWTAAFAGMTSLTRFHFVGAGLSHANDEER